MGVQRGPSSFQSFWVSPKREVDVCTVFKMKNTNKVYWARALVVVLFTAIVINHSFERGRLQYEIDYEDVITFLDGLKRYRLLVDEGQGRLQFFSML